MSEIDNNQGYQTYENNQHTNLLPAGRYRARLIEAVLSETKTGKEQIVGSFEVLDAGHEGRTVAWFGVFATPKMSQRVLESLRYCGWRGNDLTALDGVTENEVAITVEHHTYNGRTNARVAWVNRPGGVSMAAPMAADRARMFAARMAGMAAAVKAEPAPEAAPAPTPAPTLIDDCPF